jgi:hypothetical protein
VTSVGVLGLFLILRGKHSVFFTISNHVYREFFIDYFFKSDWECYLLFLICWVFCHEGMLNFVKNFFPYLLRWSCDFCP